MIESTTGEKHLTFEELQTLLRHTRINTTEQWCSRHLIRPERYYRLSDVIRERGTRLLDQHQKDS
jgi:hypothetical protein